MPLLILLTAAALAGSPVTLTLPACETLSTTACELRPDCVPQWKAASIHAPADAQQGIVGSPGRQFVGCEALTPEAREERSAFRAVCERQGGTWQQIAGGQHARCACPLPSDGAESGYGVWIEGEQCTSEAAYCAALHGVWSPPGPAEPGQCIKNDRLINNGWRSNAQPPAAQVLQSEESTATPSGP